MLKKGTLASPATALASRVLPVPGGPTSSAPLGILPPSAVYFEGFFRKSTISITSSLAPYRPATSLKVTLTSFLLASLPVDLPTLKMPPGPFPPPGPPFMVRFMPRNIHTHMSMRSTGHSSHSSHCIQSLEAFSITIFTWLSAGSASLRASNSCSALNEADTRKVNCGDLGGSWPPGNMSAYLAARSGRRVMEPL